MSSADNPKENYSRRGLLTLIGAASAAVMIGMRPTLTQAQGAGKDLPHLDPSDPTAKALGYTEDASKVDKSKFPAFKAGAKCGNCNFFQGTTGYGPCQIFPGKSVNSNGWCASHSPKAT
ncbi:MAG: high-potential iron-sulfur protein [Sinobacteraceae bacterium]|nr:high-potential iron-sulfur protein [Nevskiaceae bacterium]MBV8853733.1 high-potential iron-sulfur protein [Nevskiaceae bacterium]